MTRAMEIVAVRNTAKAFIVNQVSYRQDNGLIRQPNVFVSLSITDNGKHEFKLTLFEA